MAAATGTTAAFRLIGILDRKPPSHRAVLEIDRRAVEVKRKLLLRHERHAVVFVLRIDRGIELLVEPQSVLQAAAAASTDSHSQACFLAKLLAIDQSSYFRCG